MITRSIFRLLFMVVVMFAANEVAAIDHGSKTGTGLKLYTQYNAGALNPETDKGVLFDYKVVTIGNKSWAWTNVTGATVGGATWASQLRYWALPANAKTENNLLLRVGGTQETYGSTTNAIPETLQLSFYQNLTPGGDCESERIDYTVTEKNSKDTQDLNAPVLGVCEAGNITESTAVITMNGSDDSGNFFYHIKGNGIEEVSFLDNISLTGLTSNTSYELVITAIDFSGNESSTSLVSFVTGGFVNISSGIAKDIRFVLKSTATEFEYYYELTDSDKTFREAFIKITPAGGSEFEIKPTVSLDGKYCYGKSNDSRLSGKILKLNLGYFVYAEPLEWGDYVMENKVITEGENTGLSILHQMGGAIADPESENPVLTDVRVEDVTFEHIKLHLQGADNSGVVYYEISGAEGVVNSFHTGDYYLTNIVPGKIYTLSVVAKDLSGNYTQPTTLKVKTAAARTNIFDNENLNYNTIEKPATGGELTTIIRKNGNELTLGCTTIDTRYTGKPFNPKEAAAFKPTIEINGIKYDLGRGPEEDVEAESIRTAQITFTDLIGDTPIEEGMTLSIKWSVFWVPGNGNFFTGVFTYKVGDNGQEDIVPPTSPLVDIAGNVLSWAACSDLLTGVKEYKVYVDNVITEQIMDLGESEFSCTVPAGDVYKVEAYDFAGNKSEWNNSSTGVKELNNTKISIYRSGETIRIASDNKISMIQLFAANGKFVSSVDNSDLISVSSLPAGVYILKVKENTGNSLVFKVVL